MQRAPRRADPRRLPVGAGGGRHLPRPSPMCTWICRCRPFFAAPGLVRLFESVLEFAPTGKLLYGSDGSMPETFWYSARRARRAMEKVLDGFVDDGVVSDTVGVRRRGRRARRQRPRALRLLMTERALLVGFVDYVGRFAVRLLPPAGSVSAPTRRASPTTVPTSTSTCSRPFRPGPSCRRPPASSRWSAYPLDRAPVPRRGRRTTSASDGWPTSGGRRGPTPVPRRGPGTGRRPPRRPRAPRGSSASNRRDTCSPRDGSPQGQQHFSSRRPRLVALKPFLAEVIGGSVRGVRDIARTVQQGARPQSVRAQPAAQRDPLSAADDLVVVQEACRSAPHRRTGNGPPFSPGWSPSLPSSGSHVHVSIHEASAAMRGPRRPRISVFVVAPRSQG